MRVALYVRVSTTGQVEAQTIEQQIERLQAPCWLPTSSARTAVIWMVTNTFGLARESWPQVTFIAP